MDWEAEYLERFKHYPPAEMSWHEVLALVGRVDRFELRDRLIEADGALWGRPPLTEADVATHSLQRAKLNRLAFPGRS